MFLTWIREKKFNLKPGDLFLISVFIGANIPALFWSLNTPFALIDDYTDWQYSLMFDSFGQFVKNISDLFLGSDSRFRPFFDLSNAIAWKVFGEHYGLHHFWRWVIKSGVVFTTYLSFKEISKSSKKFSDFKFGFYVFLFLYWFTPNNPEARLAPLELYMMFFYSWSFLFLLKIFFSAKERVGLIYDGFLFSFFSALMLASKEPAIVLIPAPWLLLLWKTIKEKNHYLWVCNGLMLTMVGPVLFKIYHASQMDYQGGLAKTSQQIIHQILWNGRLMGQKGFLIDLLIIAAVFLWGLVFLKIKTGQLIDQSEKRFLGIISILIIQALMFFGILLLVPNIHLRYVYPLSYFGALVCGLLVWLIFQVDLPHPKHTIKMGICTGAIVLSLCYTFRHLYAFEYQFAVQHFSRNLEKQALDFTLEQIGSEGGVGVDRVRGEMMDKVYNYFSAYLPYFKGLRTYAEVLPVTDPRIMRLLTDEMREIPGWRLLKEFRGDQNYWFLSIAREISIVFRVPPRIVNWEDSGALPMNQYPGLYLYERQMK